MLKSFKKIIKKIKMNLFYNKVINSLRGDQKEQTAARNAEFAQAALQTKKQQFNMDKLNAQQALNQAKIKLENAKYPTSNITDVSTYWNNISACQSAVEIAQEEVNTAQANMDYVDSLITEMFAEVTA
jgi:hypothetical protein